MRSSLAVAFLSSAFLSCDAADDPDTSAQTQAVMSAMAPDSAVRGCVSWWWYAPVYRDSPESCREECIAGGADACEWYVNGDCYVEFADGGCYVTDGGFDGWYSAVDDGGAPPPPPPPPPPGGCPPDAMCAGDSVSYVEEGSTFVLVYQYDGNLVRYQDGAAIWSTGTAGTSPGYVAEENGMIVLRDGNGSVLWSREGGEVP